MRFLPCVLRLIDRSEIERSSDVRDVDEFLPFLEAEICSLVSSDSFTPAEDPAVGRIL